MQYEEECVLRGHTGPVVCVDAVNHGSSFTVVSSSSDSTMKIWERSQKGATFTLSQTESFNAGFAFGLSLISLEGSLVLACGTEANKVEIFVKQFDKASINRCKENPQSISCFLYLYFFFFSVSRSSTEFTYYLAMKIG